MAIFAANPIDRAIAWLKARWSDNCQKLGVLIGSEPDEFGQDCDYLAELARARNVAIRNAEANRDDLQAYQNALDLIALANALGAPGYDPAIRELLREISTISSEFMDLVDGAMADARAASKEVEA